MATEEIPLPSIEKAAEAVGIQDLASTQSGTVTVALKWQKREFPLDVVPGETFLDLKQQIYSLTNVLPARQKIFGIPGNIKDDADVSALKLSAGKKIMMMGTPEAFHLAEPSKEQLDGNGIINDLDLSEEGDGNVPFHEKPENKEKLEKRVAAYKINVLTAPRPGKKLLVLDVDYTIFDHRSSAENASQLRRPYLLEFLTAAYDHYDIIIWSATGMKWVALKMFELGVLRNPNFSVVALLDSRAMITVQHERYGVFETKPLAVIWHSFPEHYGPHNTIMFDDLRRNFVMNPQNGLKIRPCRSLPTTASEDVELLHLKEYLLLIQALDDFSSLQHSKWERYIEKQRQKIQRRSGNLE